MSIPISEKVGVARKPLHIVATDSLHGNEVLVHFSDGSAAIYEAEELEKLRPVPKQMLPVDWAAGRESLGLIA
jgi:hypothetical protein